MLDFKKNQKGQGVVESLLALPLVVLTFSSLLFLCYRSVVFYCADFYLHEALLCTDDSKATDCEHALHQNITKILLAQNQERVSVSRSGSQVHGRVEIYFPYLAKNFGPPLVIEKQLSLPLKSSSSWLPY